MNPLFWIVLTIIVISTLVGAVAKMLNNMNEMNAPRNRPPARAAGGAGGGGAARQQQGSDMDRFLAEIDRLRKKNAEAAPPPQGQVPVAPVVQPVKQADRPRTRVVAELAEPARRASDRGPERPTDQGFGPPIVPDATTGPKAGDLPVATVVPLPSGTGAPATKVTRIANRPRPVAKTPFAKNLTTLLNSGQGLALGIVLQEILGAPKSKRG
jgi:hypothetical protein